MPAPSFTSIQQADYLEAKKLVGNKLQRARHSLRRYCSVPNSQRDLDHVTWLKLGIFLCDKALPTSQPAPNDSDFRLSARSAYEL